MIRRRFLCLLLTFSLFLLPSACFRQKARGPAPGDPLSFNVADVPFTLRYVPAAVFPLGLDDDGTGEVTAPFWLGETEVTYALWYTVKSWAENNGYRFTQYGREGGRLGQRGQEPSEAREHPATSMNWYDAAAWCNALSEYLELTPLYQHAGAVLRNSFTLPNDAALDLLAGTGFRLPANAEWELAARYRGRDRSGGAIEYPKGSGLFWTPGTYASGAKGPVTDPRATDAVAWYQENSVVNSQGTSTRPVGQKPARGNALNLFDMSGNVFEWMHDINVFTHRGGCYYRDAEALQIGFMSPLGAAGLRDAYPNLGFRLLLPADDAPAGQPATQRQTSTAAATQTTTGETEQSTEPSQPELDYATGSLVEVKWDGRWYKALIIDRDTERYRVSYLDYDESWDEWVDPGRVRDWPGEPAIAAIKEQRLVIASGTPLDQDDLPPRAEIVLQDGSQLSAEVTWQIQAADTSRAGETIIKGSLTNLPVNLKNPAQLQASLLLRVRDEDGPQSYLRLGKETKIDGLLFYIEHDDQTTGYYYGTEDPFDLTHLIISNPDGSFAAMFVFAEDMMPIQWAYPDLSIAVLVGRNEAFDPAAARLNFLLDEEQIGFTLNLERSDPAGLVLERIPAALGMAYAEMAEELAITLAELGWLDKPVREIAALAENPHEIALASLLSLAACNLDILDRLDERISQMAAPPAPGTPGVIRLDSLPSGTLQAVPVSSVFDSLDKMARNLKFGNTGTLLDMFRYLWRIMSGHYGGRDIEGPAVSMLLCKGVSSVPGVCNEFYIPNTPGNVSRCVKVCYTSMSCFTDICHPMLFSVKEALTLRNPFR